MGGNVRDIMERIQKVIASSGYCSRRKAEELIKEGKVFVNGEMISVMGYMIKKGDSIVVDGTSLDTAKNYEYFILNKPRGVITSTSDEHGRKTVIDIVDSNQRIFPVGRLDYDTTGLLLLTNDGTLANKLMHPASGIDKTYIVKIRGIISGKDIMRLRNGVVIDGKKSAKCRVKLRSVNKKLNTSILEVTIHEGRNHQVKKMFKAVGYDVIKLKRERYAFLNLAGLKVGEYRRLTNKEIATLYSIIK